MTATRRGGHGVDSGGPWGPGERHGRGRGRLDGGGGGRPQPRDTGAQRQRVAELHPGGQLPRVGKASAYKANDGTADSNVATVSLTVTAVNDAPLAVNDSYTTAEDTALTVAAPGALGNDTDVDGDALTGGGGGRPQPRDTGAQRQRVAELHPGGQLPRFGQLHLQGNDGRPTRNVATVSLTVTAVNDARWRSMTATTTAEDTALTVAAPGALGNDTDVDGDALTAAVVAGPSHGTWCKRQRIAELHPGGQLPRVGQLHLQGQTTGRPTRTWPRCR